MSLRLRSVDAVSLASSRMAGEEAEQERRSFLRKALSAAGLSASVILNSPTLASAVDGNISSSTAKVTSKITIQLKGLPSDTDEFSEDIITIGLFGDDAPQPVSILQKLVSSDGYFAKCKPKESRTLQREQLEANKVYNSCMDTQDTKGVTYDLSIVWRIVKDERIDLGAVSGKYIARESPFFEGGNNQLKHDIEGVVSVRKGSDGAFCFSIYPGGQKQGNVELDEDYIVVGRVIDGMDVVRKLNNVPVVQSAGINYKGFSGNASSKRSAPSRACR